MNIEELIYAAACGACIENKARTKTSPMWFCASVIESVIQSLLDGARCEAVWD